MAGNKCPMLLFLNLLLQVVLSLTSELSRSMIVKFDPPVLHNLEELKEETVNVTLRFPKNEFEAENVEKFSFQMKSFSPEVASVEEPTLALTRKEFSIQPDNFYEAETVVKVKGNMLGKTGMKIRLVPAENWLDVDKGDDQFHEPTEMKRYYPVNDGKMLDVWVVRDAESVRMTKYFVASVVILISLANVLMGCELDIDAVMATLKKPVAPAIGLFAQFLIMPMLSFVIAHAVFVPRGLYSMALGVFVTGCSPGGGASNFWTLLLGGNLNLSVTMTFISTLFSLVMMPTWLFLLGGQFLQGFSTAGTLKVPYGSITRSLACLVVPLLIGVAIKKFKPTWAQKSRKVMRPFVIFVLIFVIVFGTATNLYMFRTITWPVLLGGLALPWCGFMFGCFTALLTKRSPEDVTAIAVETGIQNTGVAILLLKASFSQPDADIGAVLPVIVACFTPGPLLLGAAVHLTLKKLRQRKQRDDDCEKNDEKVQPNSQPMVSVLSQNEPLLLSSKPINEKPCPL